MTAAESPPGAGSPRSHPCPLATLHAPRCGTV